MRWECRERFSRPPRVSKPDMHHGTCIMYIPWCMPRSLISGFLWSRWREYVPGITGACANRNFTYLVRSPCGLDFTMVSKVSWLRWTASWTSECTDVLLQTKSPTLGKSHFLEQLCPGPRWPSAPHSSSHGLTILSGYELHRTPLGPDSGSYPWHVLRTQWY